jgi:hypothetical protein
MNTHSKFVFALELFYLFLCMYVIQEHDAQSSHSSRRAWQLSSSNTIQTGRQHVLPATLGLLLANRHQRKFTHPTTNFFRKINPTLLVLLQAIHATYPMPRPHIPCVIFSPMYLLLYSQTSYWKSL